MHFARLAALATALTMLAAPAFAQMSPEDMTAQIEQVHGNSAQFADAFDDVTAAMRDGDIDTVASYGSYPFQVAANGELYDIFQESDFTDNWDALLLPATIEAIGDQDYGSLIVSSDGIGFADGAMWMNFVCDDETCTGGDWLITRITN
ncbi:MAG: hypothetical protein JWR51_3218 [Devosia sp.]|uniref:hypothetical protein n=1 Tax=Devosia sp. TaxID=1871048 RepID=UPI00260944B9|nr:hypothetical protein [Devosia sp.]MDB5530115.1 hypothetical protein [Devosia sp.]